MEKSENPGTGHFVSFPHGIPSHDAFNRFFAQLDPLAFEACFKEWGPTAPFLRA